GTNPNGTRPAAPLTASLYVPSPAKTTIASAESAASAASSVAWPRASVWRRSTLAVRRSAASTCSTWGLVTPVEYGLTIRTTRCTPRNLRRCRIAAHPVEQDREEPVGERSRVVARPKPGVGPVGSREKEQGRGRNVE